VTLNAICIFKEPTIQTLMRSYRHWFAQTMIGHGMENSKGSFNQMPKLSDLKKKTTDEQHIGLKITEQQVFRLKDSDPFTIKDLKLDFDTDLPEFEDEIETKKSSITKDMTFQDMERIIIQEKGEQFYNEKKISKMRYWQD